jgi:hypothetical protein
MILAGEKQNTEMNKTPVPVPILSKKKKQID